MESLIRAIQAISVLVQFVAVILALRLIPITKAKQAWLAISSAIFLMAIRRVISLTQADYPELAGSLLWFELFGLTTSVLMVYGMAYIAPLFLELKRSGRALKEAHDHLEKRVEERTAELASANEALRAEIAERKMVESMLRLDEARLEALWQLSQMMGSSVDQLAEFALEQQIKLTRSKAGWIGLMDENERVLSIFTWSKSVMESCAIAERPVHFSVENAGIWADVIREKRAVVINDYQAPNPRKRGYPAGHMPITRLMVVPVLEADHAVAVAAVANKEEEYNPSDARQLTLLMDGMWKLVQRERAEKTLRESERLAAMGRAMSAVAHDMRTPLIAIGGFARIAERLIEKDSPAQDKLGIVLKETRRLEEMVRDVLDFSRPLELKHSAGDVCELITECLAVVEPLAQEHNVVLLNQPGHDIPPVSMDGMRMKQVLINLMTNAIEASPGGGEVAIRGHIAEGYLIIEVVDYGCGIPPEKRNEIFSPFFSTKKEGTGLGLPIVRKIVEAHKGSIEILDNPQMGVTFRVLIPIERDPAE